MIASTHNNTRADRGLGAGSELPTKSATIPATTPGDELCLFKDVAHVYNGVYHLVTLITVPHNKPFIATF